MRVTIDTRQLTQRVSDLGHADVVTRSLPRALRGVRTDATRAVTRATTLRSRDAQRRMTIDVARAQLRISDVPVPATEYRHRVTKRGVVLTAWRGHAQIVPRSWSHNGRLMMRDTRAQRPIRQVYGPSVASAVWSDIETLADQAAERLAAEVLRQLARRGVS